MPVVLSDRAARSLGGRSKYRAVPVWYCPGCDACRLARCPLHPAGVRYASKAEAWYWWNVLRPLIAAGTFAWNRQVRYRLRLPAPDGTVVDLGSYTADFVLFGPDGRERVIDVKGTLTRDGKLRLALMRVCHGIQVELVKSTPPRGWLEA